jgi:hypothetical protein
MFIRKSKIDYLQGATISIIEIPKKEWFSQVFWLPMYPREPVQAARANKTARIANFFIFIILFYIYTLMRFNAPPKK